MWLSEKEVGDADGGKHAGQVGQQTAGHGMAGVAYAHTAEVDRQDVERGVGGALEDTAEASHEGVGPIGGHGIDHHAAGTAAGEWFHECGGQCLNKVGVQSAGGHGHLHAVNQHVHGS